MTGRGRATEDGLLWKLALGATFASALSLLIWAGRDTLFSVDDLLWFMGSPGLDLNGLLQPHNGHLIAVPRLLFRATFELLGADYAAIRALTALSVGLSGALFYRWASRRTDRPVAIAGTALLLVLGTSYIFLIAGDGLMLHLALSCGLGSLLALERDDRAGDALAAGLLCLGVLTYSVALAFVVAAAASVLARPGARRRLWIPAVPALLYGAWWLWAQGNANATIDQGEISNLLLTPAYAMQSLASALGALTGLDYDFSTTDAVRPEFEINATIFGTGARAGRRQRPRLADPSLAGDTGPVDGARLPRRPLGSRRADRRRREPSRCEPVRSARLGRRPGRRGGGGRRDRVDARPPDRALGRCLLRAGGERGPAERRRRVPPRIRGTPAPGRADRDRARRCP